jgi:uncharacterized protein (DUF1499 family)
MTYHSTLRLSMALLIAAGLAGCAAPTGSATADSTDLRCTIGSNCVSSLETLRPLAYTGSAAQALAALQATLATFPEAQVLHSSALQLDTVFTTAAGFKDDVTFRLDPQTQRIDFRSRSRFGLYDFGKNRSRMKEFAARFEKRTAN